jgi:hypothetical protein
VNVVRASLLLVAIVASVFSSACQTASAGSNSFCFFESGELLTGQCLTLCQSECALLAAAGCEPADCETTCDAADAKRSSSCHDASYVYWRCLRTSGGPNVTCGDVGANFSTSSSLCASDRASETTACDAPDAGAPLPVSTGTPTTETLSP